MLNYKNYGKLTKKQYNLIIIFLRTNKQIFCYDDLDNELIEKLEEIKFFETMHHDIARLINDFYIDRLQQNKFINEHFFNVGIK